MNENRWPLGTVALLVAGAAAVKLTSAAEFAAELSALLRGAGLPVWPPEAGPVVAGTLIALEIVLGLSIVVPRTARAGLTSLLLVMAAGVVLVGLASDWGLREETTCPCGIALHVPFVRSGFAMLLVRDACIVLLVALAWGGSRARPAVAPSPP